MKPILFLLISFLFLSCNHQDKLIGKWERIGDRFSGMQIIVKNENGSFKAEMIKTTDSIIGFVIGDIKWKNIKKITNDKYEFEDLGKKPTEYIDKFNWYYTPCQLEFVSDTMIHTRVFSKGTEVIGTEQQWKKIDESK